jgi:putative ABC transport system substrate-binding protein
MMKKEIRTMKKILSILLIAILVFSLAAGGSSSENEETSSEAETSAETVSESEAETPSAKYLIGICQYGEHASLDNCREGFLQGLIDSGLLTEDDFEIDYQNAGFDDAVTTQIAQSFSAENVTLMCAIATPAATACYAAAEDKDIPVIFTAITDPAAAKLDSGNVTGTSDKLPWRRSST